MFICGESAALILVIILFIQFAGLGSEALISGIIGGIAGGIIGYVKQRELFRMSRRLLTQLRQIKED